MGGEDKGLLLFRGWPLVSYALEALKSVAGRIIISANRNLDRYAEFGYPVVPDTTGSFDGPLAGLLSALSWAESELVLTVPCDSPLVTGALLSRLAKEFADPDIEIAVADDGERLHPVFLLARRSVVASLERYLRGGGRKIDPWLREHRLARTDFSDVPELFYNVNTPEELRTLEEYLGAGPGRADGTNELGR
jgi:molybdopterin-guanine dinucleotide biosynthesis protein A